MVISQETYESYRKQINDFEAWRGNRLYYHQNEVPQALRLVTNEMRSGVEVFETLRDKPEQLFIYVKPDYEGARNGNIVTWTGERLGSYIASGPDFRSGFGDTRQPIRVELRDGAGAYYGTYYKSSGNYARLRRYKGQPK